MHERKVSEHSNTRAMGKTGTDENPFEITLRTQLLQEDQETLVGFLRISLVMTTAKQLCLDWTRKY